MAKTYSVNHRVIPRHIRRQMIHQSPLSLLNPLLSYMKSRMQFASLVTERHQGWITSQQSSSKQPAILAKKLSMNYAKESGKQMSGRRNGNNRSLSFCTSPVIRKSAQIIAQLHLSATSAKYCCILF